LSFVSKENKDIRCWKEFSRLYP